jgi:dTDP-4-dehydrorhamnose reductase
MNILVAGASGMLGKALMARLGAGCTGLDLPELDITSVSSIQAALLAYTPDVIINTAAITDVDRCQREPDLADAVHRLGVLNLAKTGVRLITISTDQVFQSGGGDYITESAIPEPSNTYALSKLRGEEHALGFRGNCVIRTSWLFGKKGMLPGMIRTLNDGGSVRAVCDQTSSVTYAGHLADAIMRAVFDEERQGLYHCVNRGAVTPFVLACSAREMLGRGSVIPCRWRDLSLPAPRPIWSALGTERDLQLPPLKEAVDICVLGMQSENT